MIRIRVCFSRKGVYQLRWIALCLVEFQSLTLRKPMLESLALEAAQKEDCEADKRLILSTTHKDLLLLFFFHTGLCLWSGQVVLWSWASGAICFPLSFLQSYMAGY
jgi:hypothetical protein